MKKSLLKYICCLYCKEELGLQNIKKSQNKEIIDGELFCKQCRRIYPVFRGVPRILPDNLEERKLSIANAFGYEWKNFNKLHTLYQKQFLDWIYPVKGESLKGKVVLDAGCGKGRHVYYSAKLGASDVIGIDLSDSVDIAYYHTKMFRNAHIIQADIYNLPFRCSFDFIYSIGVLHLLHEPATGFRSIMKFLGEKGLITAWVYSYENNEWILKYINPLRKLITSRMQYPILKLLCTTFTLFYLYPVLKLIYKPINNHMKYISNCLFYNDYLFYLSEFKFRDINCTVFDHLVAPEAHYLKEGEFKRWFLENNLKDIKITMRMKSGWKGYGRKNN